MPFCVPNAMRSSSLEMTICVTDPSWEKDSLKLNNVTNQNSLC